MTTTKRQREVLKKFSEVRVITGRGDIAVFRNLYRKGLIVTEPLARGGTILVVSPEGIATLEAMK